MAKNEKPIEAELVDESKELVVSNTPGALIAQAIEKGSDLTQLQTVLDVQIQWEANEARKAYNLAMAKFKADPPVIKKDLTVDYQPQGKARVIYNHAGLENVAATIAKALSVHGLSATWRTDQESGKAVKVTCIITHELGHSEQTSLTADPDNTGGKNSIQQVGSTVTYLSRYTILAMTGLATKEADDDGRGSEVEYISEEQKLKLTAMIDENDLGGEAYKEKLLKWMKVGKLSEIPDNQFKKAVSAINSAIKAKEEDGA